eukprot:5477850-Pleurochrysis_carterae.AAC.1
MLVTECRRCLQDELDCEGEEAEDECCDERALPDGVGLGALVEGERGGAARQHLGRQRRHHLEVEHTRRGVHLRARAERRDHSCAGKGAAGWWWWWWWWW